MKKTAKILIAPVVGLLSASLPLFAQQVSWGADTSRNMVREAHHVPDQFTEENLVWKLDMGSKNQYPMPVIIDGKALIAGATADFPEHPYWEEAHTRGGFVSCRDLRSGEEIWRVMAPDGSRPGGFGVCGSPVVIGDRVYVQSARDVMCLDLNGLADGNQGMQDELSVYTQHPFSPPEGESAPGEIPEWSGDIIWHFTYRDMPITIQDSTASTPLVFDDQVWIATANELGSEARGKTDKEGNRIEPVPAPHLLVFDRASGELIAYDEMDVPIIFHGEWSSPSLIELNGEKCVIFGDGYGVLHGFAIPEKSADGTPVVLEELWSFDTNPREWRYDENGLRHIYTPDTRLAYKYPLNWPDDKEVWMSYEQKRGNFPHGPNEVIAMPVTQGNRIYLANGRDFTYDGGGSPVHREFEGSKGRGFRRWGNGRMMCLEMEDVKQPPRIVWEDRDVGRTQSNVSIHDGLVYLVDFGGFLNCWDAETGEVIYRMDIGASVRERSQLVADGKIYVCNDRNELWVIKAGREPEVISRTRMRHHIATVEVADGLLLKVSHSGAELYRNTP